jgi:aminoglycoside phosphotransferase family enzyme
VDIKIKAKVAFLSQPESYSEHLKVEIIETHMSWVFMTRHHVYKLKKPVRYEFLDFSTIDARHHGCLEEIRLNRRLAGNVYFGIIPLTVDAHGNMHLGENGIPVDWLVQMRRLPADRMLNKAIQKQMVHETDIYKFSQVLANFYRHAEPIAITPLQYRQRFEQDIQANQQELSYPDFKLPLAQIMGITKTQLSLLEQTPELLSQRIKQGKIIEAHGDLRPEHICLTPDPVFIDCLEFKREFRLLDPVDELSFLAMECERLGAAFIGDRVLDIYQQVTKDHPPEKLIRFYKSCRASLRAKLAIWHLKDSQIQQPSKWIQRAGQGISPASREIPSFIN